MFASTQQLSLLCSLLTRGLEHGLLFTRCLSRPHIILGDMMLNLWREALLVGPVWEGALLGTGERPTQVSLGKRVAERSHAVLLTTTGEHRSTNVTE